MLEVRNISVSISGREIIKNISFSAEKSENISLIGTNGAGKTTLLRAVSSLLEHSGNVFANGTDVSLLKEKEKAKLISFVPQGAEIKGDFEVSHFLELSRYSYMKPWEKLSKEDKNAIEKAVELTGIAEFTKRRIATLSGGERQRVLIAGAIAQESSILLLDEPLTYLDPVQRIGISEIIRKIAASGRLVITVTHEINEALVFSDRILALKNGNLVFDGTPENLLQSGTLATLFDCGFVELGTAKNGRHLVFPEINS